MTEWTGPIEFALTMLRSATPLVFAAMGVLLAERSGVLHIGVEGAMLLGAFAAILAAVMLDPWTGVAVGAMVGLLAGVVLAVITVRLPSDQVVMGIAFNIAAVGVTSFAFRMTASLTQRMVPPLVSPGLADIPVVGALLAIPPLAWPAFGLAGAIWYVLHRTGPGLLLRSVGESSHAAAAAGINVLAVRFATLVLAGMLSGLGGAALTVGWVRSYSDNITLGRGFIALAAVYFGRWNPAWTVVGCLLFGAGEALAFGAQGAGANPHYYLMIPYLLTLLVVAITGRARAPQEVGRPYVRA
ncbi:MAG: ABC transporter permease [Armatimonadota bacterium]|nr:ABC transporter permease [Armatimonadota bacterium]MDR7548641.1 ABC transporter permease [Armatimonadota bacterium]